MADYYTKFSTVFTLPNQEALNYALELYLKCQNGQDVFHDPTDEHLTKLSEAHADIPEELHDHLEDWGFDCERNAPTEEGRFEIWLNSEMNGGCDACAAFLSHLLEKFDPEGSASFEIVIAPFDESKLELEVIKP